MQQTYSWNWVSLIRCGCLGAAGWTFSVRWYAKLRVMKSRRNLHCYWAAAPYWPVCKDVLAMSAGHRMYWTRLSSLQIPQQGKINLWKASSYCFYYCCFWDLYPCFQAKAPRAHCLSSLFQSDFPSDLHTSFWHSFWETCKIGQLSLREEEVAARLWVK